MTFDPTWLVQWRHRLLPVKLADLARRPGRRALEVKTNMARRVLFLRVLNRAWLVAALVAFLTLPFYPALWLVLCVVTGISVGLFVTIRALLVRQRITLAGLLFTAVVELVFLAIFVSLAEEQGWQTALLAEAPTLMMMGLAVLFAGALIDGRAAFVVAGTNSALLMVMVLVADAPDLRVSIHSFWWLLALVVWLYEKTLASTFARLHDAHTTLESTVHERTGQLSRALEQIEVILNHTSDVVVLADSAGDILKANPAFDRLLGGRIKHAIENLVHVIPDDDGKANYARALLGVIQDVTPQRIEATILLEDRTPLDADLALAPVRMPDVNRAGVLLSLRDITHLKEIDRFKSRFVANAAHDLSNPLAVLKSRLYLLKNDPDHLGRHLAILEQQTARMEYLIDDLRVLSALDRGTMMFSMETFDFNALVSCAIETHQPLAAEKGLSLTFAPDQALPPIYADPRHCERVVVNLIMNAIHYTLGDGQVTVATHCGDDTLRLAVQDTGIGISPEDLPHVFERFYRGDRAKDVDVSGTGLGLSIVKEMVEMHRGTVTVASVVGAGSTFTITIPRQHAALEGITGDFP